MLEICSKVPKVSLMLIEDEKTARELFARKRLTTNAEARLIEKESEEGKQLLAALRQRYGERIDGLACLSDFKTFSLSPKQSLYVKGFGQRFMLIKMEKSFICVADTDTDTGHGHGHGHGHGQASSHQ